MAEAPKEKVGKIFINNDQKKLIIIQVSTLEEGINLFLLLSSSQPPLCVPIFAWCLVLVGLVGLAAVVFLLVQVDLAHCSAKFSCFPVGEIIRIVGQLTKVDLTTSF